MHQKTACTYIFTYNINKDKTMFGLFKSNPTKKLRKTYDMKLEQAMHAQRKGDIKTYSMLTAESESIWTEIQVIEEKEKNK